jgi:hypothetical protein
MMEQGLKTLFEPFVFKQCISIVKSTGKRAKNLRELRELIATINEETLYYHACQYFLKMHIMEYNNDFAHWAGESLGERALAEYFSNLDPFLYRDMEEFRKMLLSAVDTYLNQFPEPREVMRGEEFYFNESVMILFPAGVRANNLAEFLIAIKYVDGPSIYYHFYEARMRSGNSVDDFSKWIEDALGKRDLAAKIRGIDPFMHNLEGIREHLVEAVEEEVKKDMEGMGQ